MTPEETKNKMFAFLDRQEITDMEKYFVIKMMEQEQLDSILNDGAEEAQEEEDDFSDFEDEEVKDPLEKVNEDDLMEEEDDDKPVPLIKKPRVKVVQ